jgi:3-deoxy-7-phosphoheptulonate synthase
MIVEMKKGCTQEEIDEVVQRAKSLELSVQLNLGTDKTVVAILGPNTGQLPTEVFAVLRGVEGVSRIMKPYKLASREFHLENSLVSINGIEVGGKRIVVMAGPCAVESEAQLMETVEVVKISGASIVRGGAFKPRTSPFSFQGLGQEGLRLLSLARERFHIPVVTEVIDPHHVTMVSGYVDILQVGARNMQNYALLTEVGKSNLPVILKRGLSSTIKEWLTAADYILAEGNPRVILCDRGIRTFEDSIRFSLDITSVPVVKRVSHLPIIVDPSHASGHYSIVPAVARAAIAAGADGILIEVHPRPKEALVDGPQALTPSDFDRLMKDLSAIARAIGRYI